MTAPNQQLFPSFVAADQAAWQTMAPGVRRQILAYGPDLMLVRVAFEAGGVGAIHQHPHAQISYVESGEFIYTIGDEVQTLSAGASCYVPGNTSHGVVCQAAGVLLDSFTPRRDDFLE